MGTSSPESYPHRIGPLCWRTTYSLPPALPSRRRCTERISSRKPPECSSTPWRLSEAMSIGLSRPILRCPPKPEIGGFPKVRSRRIGMDGLKSSFRNRALRFKSKQQHQCVTLYVMICSVILFDKFTCIDCDVFILCNLKFG